MKIKIFGFGLAIASFLSLGLVSCSNQTQQNQAAKSQDMAIAATPKPQAKRHGFQRTKPDGNISKHAVVYSAYASISPEQSPEFVVSAVYQGVQKIHNYQGTPHLKWGMTAGATSGGCGAITSTHYCKLDNTIYITNEDVQLAYQYGDASLAYIIGHEYAHAMQTAFGFQPKITPISELQADCLSGVYLGTIPDTTFDRQDIDEIRSLAYHLGDSKLGHPDHHGTPAERLAAVEIGIQGAIDGRGFSVCKLPQ